MQTVKCQKSERNARYCFTKHVLRTVRLPKMANISNNMATSEIYPECIYSNESSNLTEIGISSECRFLDVSNNLTISEFTPECRLFPGHLSYCTLLIWCKRVSVSLSICGCMFAAFIIWLFNKYKEIYQRMILQLIIATLLQDAAYLLVDIVTETTPLCLIQATLIQFTAIVTILWICIIIFDLLANIVWGKPIRKFEIPISLCCWSVAAITAGLPFTGDAYGSAGAWCWLKNKWVWRFGLLYIWSFISFVFVFCSVLVMASKVRGSFKRNLGPSALGLVRRQLSVKEDIKTLKTYPVVYLIVIIFPLIHRIQNAISSSDGTFWLVLLHTLAGPLDGAAMSLAFITDRMTRSTFHISSIKEAWKKKFHRKASRAESMELRFSVSSVELNRPGSKKSVIFNIPVEQSNVKKNASETTIESVLNT